MLKSELKAYLESELMEKYNNMKLWKNDKNPQIIAMYNQASGAYDALDELYYKSFHRYFKVVE